jgi:hypothetical protein
VTTQLRSTFRRAVGSVLVAGVAAAMVGVLAAPARARVTQTNGEFCAVFSAQLPSIDFEGLGPDEAVLGAKLFRQAAKTGVPAKIKADLKKVAKVYERIGHGEPAADVLDAAQQRRILPSLRRFSKYFATNCFASAPST